VFDLRQMACSALGALTRSGHSLQPIPPPRLFLLWLVVLCLIALLVSAIHTRGSAPIPGLGRGAVAPPTPTKQTKERVSLGCTYSHVLHRCCCLLSRGTVPSAAYWPMEEVCTTSVMPTPSSTTSRPALQKQCTMQGQAKHWGPEGYTPATRHDIP
jgi:hypothetical protein